MKNKLIIFCGLFLSNTVIHAVLINGIEFPDGAISFADVVINYVPGDDVGGIYINPTNAIGIPDWVSSTDEGIVSLGEEGELVLKFTNNFLTTSGDSNMDLWIFEVGSAVEAINIAISVDGINWIDVGNVAGSIAGIDIDAINEVVPNELYSFVRLLDILPNQSGFPFGEADIDAVGAISNISIDLIFEDSFEISN